MRGAEAPDAIKEASREDQRVATTTIGGRLEMHSHVEVSCFDEQFEYLRLTAEDAHLIDQHERRFRAFADLGTPLSDVEGRTPTALVPATSGPAQQVEREKKPARR